MTARSIAPASRRSLAPPTDLAVARAAVRRRARRATPSHEANRARDPRLPRRAPRRAPPLLPDGPPHRLGRGDRPGEHATSCSCSTPRCSAGSSPAVTPTATPTWPPLPSARPRRRPASSGCAVVTPAIDLDVHVFHNAAGTEPDHLHLDVRHLVLAPAGAVPVGNHESEGLALGRRRRPAALDVDLGTMRMADAAGPRRARPASGRR